MAKNIERITMSVSIVAFVVAAIAGWVVLNQRTSSQPVQISKQAIGGVIRTHHKALIQDPDDPVLGNPDGDDTVVGFFDYCCTYCKQVHPIATL